MIKSISQYNSGEDILLKTLFKKGHETRNQTINKKTIQLTEAYDTRDHTEDDEGKYEAVDVEADNLVEVYTTLK